MEESIEIVWNFPILDIIWSPWPLSVKIGWFLLGCAIIILVLSIYFLRKKINKASRNTVLTILLARVTALIAIAFCIWGIGTNAFVSGLNIDNPRIDVVENMGSAFVRSCMLIQFFVTATTVVMVLGYIIEYIERRRRQKDMYPIE